MKKIIMFGILLSVHLCLSNLALYANELSTNSQSSDADYSFKNWGRDPFTPSALMYEQVGLHDGKISGILGFIPTSESTKIPVMKLRGLINNKKDDFIALLEVQGFGTFMVREGDEFNIDPSQPKNAIRINQITRLSVTVETGRLGSIRVLR